MDDAKTGEPADRSSEERPEAADPAYSLEDLSTVYAELVRRSGGAADKTPEGSARSADTAPTAEPDDQPALPDVHPAGAADQTPDEGHVTPEGIVEAILFVGHPENRPVTAHEMADLMGDVACEEVERIIEKLNRQYESADAPYRILAVDGGYRMELTDKWLPLRRRFYARDREARLSQAAIDTLALVAYNPGITREEIERLREKSSQAILAQLVRRRLLRVEPVPDNRRQKRYFPTERFLELFGLDSLDDLPVPAE